jgi:DNA topoisomerase-3
MVSDVLASSASFKADNVSKSKCPACGKNMLAVNGKKGKMLVCPDRSCGYRQDQDPDRDDVFKKGKNSSRINQKLIERYSDKDNISQNLGEKLKAALEKKEKGE